MREPFGISGSFFATAASDAPVEIPAKTPSSFAAFRAYSKASSLLIRIMPSSSSL
jgi:hypothetical protein